MMRTTSYWYDILLTSLRWHETFPLHLLYVDLYSFSFSTESSEVKIKHTTHLFTIEKNGYKMALGVCKMAMGSSRWFQKLTPKPNFVQV